MHPESWQEWSKSPLLDDEDVAAIRAELPFGPISLREAEVWASAHQVHPLTILNIAAGRSYRRPKACPDGHPLRLALNAEAAAAQRVRYRHRNTARLLATPRTGSAATAVPTCPARGGPP